MSFLNVLDRLKTAAHDRQRGFHPHLANVRRDDLAELLRKFEEGDRFSRRLHAQHESALDDVKALTAERDALAAKLTDIRKVWIDVGGYLDTTADFEALRVAIEGLGV